MYVHCNILAEAMNGSVPTIFHLSNVSAYLCCITEWQILTMQERLHGKYVVI